MGNIVRKTRCGLTHLVQRAWARQQSQLFQATCRFSWRYGHGHGDCKAVSDPAAWLTLLCVASVRAHADVRTVSPFSDAQRSGRHTPAARRALRGGQSFAHLQPKFQPKHRCCSSAALLFRIGTSRPIKRCESRAFRPLGSWQQGRPSCLPTMLQPHSSFCPPHSSKTHPGQRGASRRPL